MTASPVDLDAFRRAFRRHAAGVAIVTVLEPDGAPAAFTATSVASLAAVPPMATFNMARSASAWPAVASATHLVLHMLGARNRALAERMAGPRGSRFDGVGWRPGPGGAPVLDGVTAWMGGRILERFEVHESAIVALRVDEGALGEADAPLLYHERSYRTPGDVV
ncbi:flavin-dependent reductase [Agromyces rhizosphaerae]|uniref:Flavin-dependent reductase n=1 Tax=Agromyces rhizosphaerae TaxID=88374 RepID=A0A9W6CU36_9MICO|nr:flavin reductase family protein [Agromyces rhizosphaerae]GLI29066.1 flavin-dependent reductase [Agromyces rhizosphaerae]